MTKRRKKSYKNTTSNSLPGIKRRGFASMDKERRKKVASKGGKAAHKAGTAHEWTTDEARKAGKIGGSK